ncbi:MAG: class I SAM-dependent methyltransferase, partial [Peptoniphilaceae bacterium]|nr:class I SAM-dependent methyltransferase [Peptoniphilaceae bacterium]MDY5765622.1 class I SAM-dependent methyltransferase [Peptoniphilaceae bacterium]
PEVIEIRKKVLGQGYNEKLISGDMFQLHWIQKIDTTLPTLISAAGVYQYFHESEIIEMIQKMKAQIPYGELVFDATNSKGLRFANKYVKKTGNDNAQMHFSVDDPGEFARRTCTELIEVDGFFRSALKECHGLRRTTRITMYFADRWKRTLVLHFVFQ